MAEAGMIRATVLLFPVGGEQIWLTAAWEIGQPTAASVSQS